MSVSLTQALSIALSGLQTNTSLISLASKNISNAQTAGYTEKSGTVSSIDFGNNFGGSAIIGYTRATDSALTSNYNIATSASSYASTQNNYMTQVQTILDSTATNPTLSNDMAQFASAWNQYASQPESSLQQQNVLSTAQTLVSDIQTASTQMGTLQSQIQGDISNNVTSLDSYINQVAAVNKEIQIASTSGQPTVDLSDQLDTLVNKISTLTSVTVQPRQNGQIALYTPSGQLLVDGITPQSFTYSGGHIVDSIGANVTSGLSGGSLQAALDFVDTSSSAASSTIPGVGVIAKFSAQMSKMVDALTNSSGGTPSAFATAFSSAATASTAVGAGQEGDSVPSSFFTVSNGLNGQPDPSTLAISAGLLAGTSDLPQTNAQSIADSFGSVANYTTSGLSAQSVTYEGLASSILSTFQQTASTISSQSTTATTQQSYYQTTIANTTGVNIDTELTNLVAYQNSYAASAHVISTINQMLTTLIGILP